MKDICILFAENDPDFLDTRAEFLIRAGYRVVKAISLSAARRLLQTERIHLAVLDIRLVDNDDDKDISGLTLAKDEAFRHIPKILLTKYPSYEQVRVALGMATKEMPPAVDYIGKGEGPEAMIAAVEQALANHVGINWELVVAWDGVLSFAQLRQLIAPDTSSTRLVERAAELEDLLRRLFREYAQLTIGAPLRWGGGRAMLPVFAFDANGREEQFLISVGTQTAVSAELERYETAVPQQYRVGQVVLTRQVMTMRVGALAFLVRGADLEQVETMASFYRRAPAGALAQVVDTLYRRVLQPWYGRGRSRRNGEALPAYWRARLGLEAQQSDLWQSKIAHLCQRGLEANILHVAYAPHQLIFQFGRETGLTLLNPVRGWAAMQRPVGAEAWGVIHGSVAADSVLLGGSDQTWLYDFAQVAEGPLLADFVSLETTVRYALWDSRDMWARYTLEKRLLDDDWPVEETTTVAGVLAIVQRIRRLAGEITGCDPAAYRQVVYFQALALLNTYNPDHCYKRIELIRYLHALLAAALQVEQSETVIDKYPQQALASMWLDQENSMAIVEGEAVPLTLQEFQILSYLYQHAGKLCRREDIVTEALEENFDTYIDNESRVTTAISRLRKKIEPDPNENRYLITVHGHGYRLDL